MWILRHASRHNDVYLATDNCAVVKTVAPVFAGGTNAACIPLGFASIKSAVVKSSPVTLVDEKYATAKKKHYEDGKSKDGSCLKKFHADGKGKDGPRLNDEIRWKLEDTIRAAADQYDDLCTDRFLEAKSEDYIVWPGDVFDDDNEYLQRLCNWILSKDPSETIQEAQIRTSMLDSPFQDVDVNFYDYFESRLSHHGVNGWYLKQCFLHDEP